MFFLIQRILPGFLLEHRGQYLVYYFPFSDSFDLRHKNFHNLAFVFWGRSLNGKFRQNALDDFSDFFFTEHFRSKLFIDSNTF